MKVFKNCLSDLNQMRLFVRVLGWFQIPMIGYLSPRVVSLNNEEVQLKIKLRRRSKNHLGSMYLGALTVGADLAAGAHAFYFANAYKEKLSFAFKGMRAEFLKRPETDVFFVCKEGEVIKRLVEESMLTGERVNQEVLVEALNTDDEVVANFYMTCSIKMK